MGSPDGSVQAARIQVPLVLGWAVSVYKSQGLALDRVKVNLNRTFKGAQAYAALSRATSQEGLQVTGLDQVRFQVDRKVLNFYKKLRS